MSHFPRFSILCLIALSAHAATISIDFEGLTDGAAAANSYSNLTFENATVLAAGVSLNELEFPPHSGSNVIFDDGAPVFARFAAPVTAVGIYVTHLQTVTLEAFDASGNLVSSVTTPSQNNLALSGDSQTSPNEFLSVAAPLIASVEIAGSPAGGSFAADDFSWSTQAVPEPGTAGSLGLALLLALFSLRARKRIGSHLLLVLLAATALNLSAADPAITLSLSSNTVASGSGVALTATAAINSPDVLQVNLLRIDQGAATIVGPMQSVAPSGANQVFTAIVNTSGFSSGLIGFRASAALKNGLKRLQSDIVYLTVTGGDQSPGGWADRLLHPPGGQSPKSAILDLFNFAAIGVYDPHGNAISAGAERSVTDFYTYDFEVDVLANAMARSDRTTLAAFCNLLNAGPFGDNPITPASLVADLQETIQSAQANPDDPGALVPLLIYELGKRQTDSYDLLNPALDAAAVNLDPVQALLLICEYYLPGLASGNPPPSGLLPLNNAIAAGVSAGFYSRSATRINPMSMAAPIRARAADNPVIIWGKWLLNRYGAGFVKKILAWGPIAIESIHGLILAYSIQVLELPSANTTHYGHGEEPVHLYFPIQVIMRDQLPQAFIDYGWLAGVMFPAKGGVPNIKMYWQKGELAMYGTFNCPEFGCAKTDKMGVATLEFIPNQEEQPGVGKNVEYTGVVDGIALYLSSLRNRMVGSVAEWTSPKDGIERWFVSRHEPEGWGGQIQLSESGHTLQTDLSADGIKYTYQEDTVSGTAAYFSRNGQHLGPTAVSLGSYSSEVSHTSVYVEVEQYIYDDLPRHCSHLERYVSIFTTHASFSLKSNYPGVTALADAISVDSSAAGTLHFFPLQYGQEQPQSPEQIDFVVQDSCTGNFETTDSRGVDILYFPDLFVLPPTDPAKPWVGSIVKASKIDGIPTTLSAAWGFADLSTDPNTPPPQSPPLPPPPAPVAVASVSGRQ